MPRSKQQLQIPLLQSEQAKYESLISGLYSTIEVFKSIMLERIDRIEKRINALEMVTTPDYTNYISSIQKGIVGLQNLFVKLDDVTKVIVHNNEMISKEVITSGIQEQAHILNSISASYFEATEELYNKFKIIENNILYNYEHLKCFIENRDREQIDYKYITENFSDIHVQLENVKTNLQRLIQDYSTNKYKNPYIFECIYKKDLPIAEFSNFSKAIVYKSGVFKKIAFYKNNGKQWIKLK